MSKSRQTPGFQRFEFRPGIKGFPNMKGMNRQYDAGAIPPNQFYRLQNVRCLEGEVVSRGGLSRVNGLAETGCITGLFDNLEPGGNEGFFFTANSPVGEVVRIATWDGSAYSDLFAGDPNGGASCVGFTSYQGSPLIVLGLKGYRVESDGSLTELFTLSSAAQDVTEGYDGKLYLIINLNTELVSWDGAGFTLETTAIEMNRVWSSANEIYLAGANGGSPFIAVQSAAWANVSWTGPAAATPKSRLVEAFGKAWTGWAEDGGSENNFIVSLVGSTMAVERVPGSHGGCANPGVCGLALQGSTLVYAYNDTDPKVVLGTYDGVTWTDVVKNLNDQAEIFTSFCDDLVVFDGDLYMFEDGNSATPVRESNVIRCSTVGGTWLADVVPTGKFSGNQDIPSTPMVVITS